MVAAGLPSVLVRLSGAGAYLVEARRCLISTSALLGSQVGGSGVGGALGVSVGGLVAEVAHSRARGSDGGLWPPVEVEGCAAATALAGRSVYLGKWARQHSVRGTPALENVAIIAANSAW